ncbi:PREDICTED: cartilage acidic protein 1-like [Branchiostoma belcheri]|uniref:Cartilage acidic protein 1-like n=1 Tax=Branchiostoma belcheri TaxID=7741 RepID=A0A6P4ZGW9_BRABE|nr:PREDICTED: cartilage acidic protein 1-like [Branchiostoma belcheri]
MASLLALFVLVGSAFSVEGWPTGAPVSQCGSMRPGHGLPPRDGGGGYGVFLTPTATPGEWTVTLNGTSGFRGFLLQARTETDGDIVGTWGDLPPRTKLVACGGSPDSAVTHTNPDRLHFHSLHFVWKTDTCDSPAVYFQTTVVTNYAEVYEGVRSDVLRNVCVERPTQNPASDPVEIASVGEDCAAPREILHGYVREGPAEVRDGETVTRLFHYSCKEGHELVGQERILCQSTYNEEERGHSARHTAPDRSPHADGAPAEERASRGGHHRSHRGHHHRSSRQTTGMFESVTDLALPPDQTSNPPQKNYGVAVTDVDHDGNMEFVVAGYNGPNLVLKWNAEAQRYENIAVDDPNSPYYPLRDVTGDAIGVAACDIDGDGWEEIYFLNLNHSYSGGPTTGHRLFRLHQGRYMDVFAEGYNRAVDGRFAGRSVACIDRKGNGLYSVYVANYAHYNIGPQGLIEMDPDTSDPGNGIIRLKNVAKEAGVEKLTGGRGVTVGPIVNERNMSDIFCGNERGPNFLFENQGDGTFQDMAERAGILDADRHNDHWHSRNGRGVALADFNGDGLVDIVNGNWMGPHRLWIQQRRDGTATFRDLGGTNAAFQNPSPVRTVIANDFDNDGQIEVFFNDIVNWRHGPTAPNRLFKVTRQGAELDPTIDQLDVGDALEPEGYGTGGAAADLDGDGQLELILAHGESNTQPLTVFRVTQGQGNNWIRIYPTTKYGAPARGSRVTIRTASGDVQLRVIDGGSGYLCQMEPIAHFGLGTDTAVQVEVTWPDGRQFSRELNPREMRQTVTIKHPDADSLEMHQGRRPRCVPIACEDPPSVENGQVLGEGRRYKDVVTYSCSAGYRLQGAPSAVCQAGKQWVFTASDEPRCVELRTWDQVTFSELTRGLASRDLLVIDVRQPLELQRDGAIPGAVNIPMHQLESALRMLDQAFQQRFGVTKPQPDADNVVFTCRTGVRARRAQRLARRLGFSRWGLVLPSICFLTITRIT